MTASIRASLLLLLLVLAWGLKPEAFGDAVRAISASTTDSHQSVRKQRVGEGAQAYWLYLPDQPLPQDAPVILFLHGWMAMDPYDYGGWIDHLARRGNIVIYPVFQAGRDDPPARMLNEALTATRNALDHLRGEGPIRPQIDRFAIVGHSLGGGIAAQVAARAEEAGLPTPKAIMSVQPGWRGSTSDYPLAALKNIPASVLVLVVEGDEDQFEQSRLGANIHAGANNTTARRKRLLEIVSDSSRTPPLIADHASPLAPLEAYRAEPSTARKERRRRFANWVTGMRPGSIDALDREGYWPLFDALYTTAFRGGDADMETVLQHAAGGRPVRWRLEHAP